MNQESKIKSKSKTIPDDMHQLIRAETSDMVPTVGSSETSTRSNLFFANESFMSNNDTSSGSDSSDDIDSSDDSEFSDDSDS